jgi:5-methyltetrahydrofolate--homocysteine methyltransferase
MLDPRISIRLKELVLNLDGSGVEKATREALEAGNSPQDIISDGLSRGMEEVGERFERREFFLPELMLSAKVMKAALDILRPHIAEKNQQSAGRIVLGTIQGDVHYIGKNILAAVLEGEGFTVFDLGEDVPPEDFVGKAEEVQAQVIGISALISTAVSKMAEAIILLRELGLAAKIIVGGAAITKTSVETIGADAYGKDAWAGLKEIRKLISGGRIE